MKVDFDALYRDHYHRVFGLCLRLLGRRAQAEDATQEAFVRAYRSIDRYRPEQPFAPWVLGIASNYCIDLLRRRAREPLFAEEVDIDVGELQADAVEVPETLAEAEDAAVVRAAIDALPDRYRLPVVLAYYREASYDEIAAQLGITANHVGVLLLRARRALRQALASLEQAP